MSENRDTRAIFSASHCTDEFALIEDVNIDNEYEF